MKKEATIKVSIYDVFNYGAEDMGLELEDYEVSKVLEYIEENHDCNLSFWENVHVAIEATREEVNPV